MTCLQLHVRLAAGQLEAPEQHRDVARPETAAAATLATPCCSSTRASRAASPHHAASTPSCRCLLPLQEALDLIRDGLRLVRGRAGLNEGDGQRRVGLSGAQHLLGHLGTLGAQAIRGGTMSEQSRMEGSAHVRRPCSCLHLPTHSAQRGVHRGRATSIWLQDGQHRPLTKHSGLHPGIGNALLASRKT